MDLPPQNDRPPGLLNFGVMALRGLHVMRIREWEFVFVYFGGAVIIAFTSLIFWGRHGGVRRGGWAMYDEQGSEKDLKSIVFFLMLCVPGSG
jgi:hypothetical protein